MKCKYFALLLTILLTLTFAKAVPKRSWSVLETENIQTASQHDGLPVDNWIGYTPSAIDAANFINHCSQRILTNGQSFSEGSCNGIVMGDIPSEESMISTIITYPFPGQILLANAPFFIKFKTSNLVSGSVTNPNATLYSAPQSLDGGKVVGHVHVTIQSLGDVDAHPDSLTPPNPNEPVFFRTVFGRGDGSGGFSVNVPRGLPHGYYRVCTMVAASNHQPVVMPVVERGAQDDCQKFLVAP
ncbi:hypothetical protein BJY04DRAFT_218537 [Aspergillus karnatakaensis]|uniref:uncharacterized protein n=1 Tax=Aspergillus karnatakaensis TaxID=1810916 RepID=UPI003CCD5E51